MEQPGVQFELYPAVLLYKTKWLEKLKFYSIAQKTHWDFCQKREKTVH